MLLSAIVEARSKLREEVARHEEVLSGCERAAALRAGRAARVRRGATVAARGAAARRRRAERLPAARDAAEAGHGLAVPPGRAEARGAGGVVTFCWSGVGDGGVRGDRSGERRVALRRGEASCAAALGGARPDGPGDDDAVFVLGAGDDRVAWMAASMGERDAWVEAVAACLEEGGDASRPPVGADGGGGCGAARPSRRPSPASRARATGPPSCSGGDAYACVHALCKALGALIVLCPLSTHASPLELRVSFAAREAGPPRRPPPIGAAGAAARRGNLGSPSPSFAQKPWRR
ncbi:hypothetical protein JL721_4402 [Aureococcus anophagefferens]|nr:hypothetical protein JL721_4402 [Aureococcus anophagefferens]